MSVPGDIKRALLREKQRKRFEKIHKKVASYTMVTPYSLFNTLRLVERLQDLPGCVVECGVWRGGMSAAIACILGPSRRYYLFDSFEGLPAAQPIDGAAAVDWQKDTHGPNYFDNCAAEPEFARRAMILAGARHFELVKGWFNETLPAFNPPETIAVLRLDGDWYSSTLTCLEALFDRVTPGGLILIDDYFAWDGCSRAVHDFLSRRSAVERVQSYRDICFIEKRGPDAGKAPLRFWPLDLR